MMIGMPFLFYLAPAPLITLFLRDCVPKMPEPL